MWFSASSTEGFTFVLAGLKAFLEHNIILNLVADRHPCVDVDRPACGSVVHERAAGDVDGGGRHGASLI
jgi:hypothetical protein